MGQACLAYSLGAHSPPWCGEHGSKGMKWLVSGQKAGKDECLPFSYNSVQNPAASILGRYLFSVKLLGRFCQRHAQNCVLGNYKSHQVDKPNELSRPNLVKL